MRVVAAAMDAIGGAMKPIAGAMGSIGGAMGCIGGAMKPIGGDIKKLPYILILYGSCFYFTIRKTLLFHNHIFYFPTCRFNIGT